ncbi:Protein LSM12-like protein [Leptotrombidium deliense]|uniref:Protein LSM12-like protein n=1 Tax=Leptotrombidium deliense TaxID=299467 RepID=A0A443SKM3_9ACAR|nr:Protein LSM12-like protein [Leptotrombidium deliense]
MSEDVELMFNSGSVVAVKTCFNHAIEGEVIAFDYNKRVLMIKCPASLGGSSHNNVHLINLDYVTDVQIKKDVKKDDSSSASLPHLDINKVERKTRTAIEERRRLAEAFSGGISDEGIKVFLSLTKTIGNVTWDGKNIIVMNNVEISQPYKPDNCAPHSHAASGDRRAVPSAKNAEAVNYVRQLVEKFWNDQPKENDVKADHPPSNPPSGYSQKSVPHKKQLNKNGSNSSTSSEAKS